MELIEIIFKLKKKFKMGQKVRIKGTSLEGNIIAVALSNKVVKVDIPRFCKIHFHVDNLEVVNESLSDG